MLKGNVDNILGALKKNKSMSSRTLAKELNISVRNVERFAEYLEEDGVVTIEHKITGTVITLNQQDDKKKSAEDEIKNLPKFIRLSKNLKKKKKEKDSSNDTKKKEKKPLSKPIDPYKLVKGDINVEEKKNTLPEIKIVMPENMEFFADKRKKKKKSKKKKDEWHDEVERKKLDESASILSYKKELEKRMDDELKKLQQSLEKNFQSEIDELKKKSEEAKKKQKDLLEKELQDNVKDSLTKHKKDLEKELEKSLKISAYMKELLENTENELTALEKIIETDLVKYREHILLELNKIVEKDILTTDDRAKTKAENRKTNLENYAKKFTLLTKTKANTLKGKIAESIQQIRKNVSKKLDTFLIRIEEEYDSPVTKQELNKIQTWLLDIKKRLETKKQVFDTLVEDALAKIYSDINKEIEREIAKLKKLIAKLNMLELEKIKREKELKAAEEKAKKIQKEKENKAKSVSTKKEETQNKPAIIKEDLPGENDKEKIEKLILKMREKVKVYDIDNLNIDYRKAYTLYIQSTTLDKKDRYLLGEGLENIFQDLKGRYKLQI